MSRSILYVHGNSEMVGGIETFLYDSFAQHKSFVPHAMFINDGVLPKRIQQRGFANVTVLNGGRLRYLIRTLRTVRKISRYIRENKINIVLAHGHHAWIYAGLAAKLARVKSVFFAHAIMAPADTSIYRPIEFIGNHITPSLILANSEATKNSIEQIWKKPCIKPVYGIDLKRFLSLENSNERLRENINIPKSSPVVAMIGRIQEWKGQEYLLKAVPDILKAVPDAHFLVVGSPTFEKDVPYLNRLKKLAKDANAEDRVFFLGFREDIPEILAASDVVVHASIEPEPFGLVILEAMAAGKPVVATNKGGPAEIIRDNQDGFLIPAANVKELSEKVIRLLRDDNLRLEFGKNARIRAGEFSIECCMNDIESLLMELISK